MNRNFQLSTFNFQLNINNLSVGYNQKTVMSDINLSAQNGDFIALIGKNGAGKSTLLKTLSGILPALSGEVLLNDLNLTTMPATERARYVSIVLTGKVDVPIAVREFLALGRQPYTNVWGHLSKQDWQIIDEVGEKLRITAYFNRNINTLSDGERQKVLIARALVQDTPVLLLDEPTTHLDLENKAILINNLLKISKEENKIIILSTHDINLILPKINKIWTTDKSVVQVNKSLGLNAVFQSELLKFDEKCQIFRLL